MKKSFNEHRNIQRKLGLEEPVSEKVEVAIMNWNRKGLQNASRIMRIAFLSNVIVPWAGTAQATGTSLLYKPIRHVVFAGALGRVKTDT